MLRHLFAKYAVTAQLMSLLANKQALIAWQVNPALATLLNVDGSAFKQPAQQ